MPEGRGRNQWKSVDFELAMDTNELTHVKLHSEVVTGLASLRADSALPAQRSSEARSFLLKQLSHDGTPNLEHLPCQSRHDHFMPCSASYACFPYISCGCFATRHHCSLPVSLIHASSFSQPPLRFKSCTSSSPF